MTVVARSHDLVLWGRVAGYDPAHLDELLYRDRAFFDYGGHLDIYPMAELPHWRLHMRWCLGDERHAAFTTAIAIRWRSATRGGLGRRAGAGRRAGSLLWGARASDPATASGERSRGES